MALIDVVKYEGNDREFVWKFPSENLRYGTQLVVHQGQSAFFVKGGAVLDLFEQGTHTLESNNIPMLTKLMSLPFGGDTPFQAEVWFVNRINKLDNKWGTGTPIQLEDPKYGVIVPVSAYGQFGFNIGDPKVFLEDIVGNQRTYKADKIVEYFKGKVMSSVSSLIGKAMIKENISVTQISAFTDELSEFCKQKMQEEFNKYGIELVNFFFSSISVKEDDPSYVKLRQIKEKAAELNVIGRDIYQFDRSMDVMETAAGNEGTSGTMMGAGMGMGMGLNVGSAMGQQMGSLSGQLDSSGPDQPPAIKKDAGFFFAIDEQQYGPYEMPQIQQLVQEGRITQEITAWKKGMADWTPAGEVQELASLFQPDSDAPPPIPPKG